MPLFVNESELRISRTTWQHPTLTNLMGHRPRPIDPRDPSTHATNRPITVSDACHWLVTFVQWCCKSVSDVFYHLQKFKIWNCNQFFFIDLSCVVDVNFEKLFSYRSFHKFFLQFWYWVIYCRENLMRSYFLQNCFSFPDSAAALCVFIGRLIHSSHSPGPIFNGLFMCRQ